MSSIFSYDGGYTTTGNMDVDNRVYMTMAVSSDGTGEGTAIYTGNAPVTGFKVRESVDYTIGKALSRDFLVASFGDLPVEITVSGFTMTEACLAGKSNSPDKDVLGLWKSYKFSNNPMARFIIGISTGVATSSYKCILLKCDVEATPDVAKQNSLIYSLIFHGIRKN